MSNSDYPAPPPPPSQPLPGEFEDGKFHLPRTNLFPGIRRQLSALEQQPQFKSGGGPWRSFLLTLLVSGLLVSPITAITIYGIQPALGSQTWVAWVFINPLLVAVFEVLAMLIVSYLALGMIPNRRYGFVMGAMAGLGAGVVDIILNLFYPGPAFWFFMLPIQSMVLATFWGIGVFALWANKAPGKSFANSIKGIPLEFLALSLIFVIVFKGVESLPFGSYYWVPYLLLPLYLFFLRDFLGGNFNFQNFFKPLFEPGPSSFPEPPPPPPDES